MWVFFRRSIILLRFAPLPPLPHRRHFLFVFVFVLACQQSSVSVRRGYKRRPDRFNKRRPDVVIFHFFLLFHHGPQVQTSFSSLFSLNAFGLLYALCASSAPFRPRFPIEGRNTKVVLVLRILYNGKLFMTYDVLHPFSAFHPCCSFRSFGDRQERRNVHVVGNHPSYI